MAGRKKAEVAEKPVKTVTAPVEKKQTASQKIDAIGIEAVCERIAECITIEAIAAEIGVTKWDVLRYVNSDLHHDAHMRAREAQADKHAADILAISDEIEVEAKYNDDDVTLDLSATAIARNRLRVDTRKWLAAKMAPKKYGERQQVDLNATVDITIEQVDAKIARLLSK